MTTTIRIEGQISGNITLHNAIITYEGQSRRIMFNGYEITFPSKKIAVAAIRAAYNSLVRDEPEMKGGIGGIRTNKGRTFLGYDASTAKIIDND